MVYNSKRYIFESQIKTITLKIKTMNLEILKKANFPQSYPTQDLAFENGTGDNFFPLPDGNMICISENDPLFIELIEAGFKTLIQLFLEKK